MWSIDVLCHYIYFSTLYSHVFDWFVNSASHRTPPWSAQKVRTWHGPATLDSGFGTPDWSNENIIAHQYILFKNNWFMDKISKTFEEAQLYLHGQISNELTFFVNIDEVLIYHNWECDYGAFTKIKEKNLKVLGCTAPCNSHLNGLLIHKKTSKSIGKLVGNTPDLSFFTLALDPYSTKGFHDVNKKLSQNKNP
jgi:hypothetical protein